ncbi:hypothetical protein RDI58_021573 [Solanum bulbocastanum]|uniref:Transcription initiation factor TFIID subunit 12 domain-containing protein n=1 Tax=Solanum bulbocastanum TaxID=147425 RepID=A0AAN8T495_SOLBU
MEQSQPPPTTPTPAPATPISQPTEQIPAACPAPSPPSSTAISQLPSTTTTTSVASQPVNLNPTSTTSATKTTVITTITSGTKTITTTTISPGGTITAAAAAQQQNPSAATSQNAQERQPFGRPWQQPSPFQHFSLPPPPPPPPPHSSSSSSSISSSSVSMQNQNPRGGMAMGVPAHHPSSSFSSLTTPSYGQQFGGLGRNLPDSTPPTSTTSQGVRMDVANWIKAMDCDFTMQGSIPSFIYFYFGDTLQSTIVSSGVKLSITVLGIIDHAIIFGQIPVRQPIQGMHGMGMMGSLGSTSPMRPAGVSPQQLRPVSSLIRPQTSISSQSAATQNFQGHSMLRVQSVGFPPSQSHTSSQSPRTQTQPWLSSGAPGKPPLPTPSLRPQINPQSLHQRSHILAPHQQTVTTTSSAQQSQPSASSQSQDHLGQQIPPSRIQQSLSNQPLGRGQGLGIQRPSSHALMQPTTVQPGPPSKAATTLEMGDPCTRILSKRSIQEIVTQIDPSEKLDAEVEDILVDIAEEFVESITTFGCSLAKHRKSNTLEAKDILLHLERNWNMTLPGFGGDEIRAYKKPLTSDIHKERIAAIKKSALVAEMTNAKGPTQTGGNMKSHLAKNAANILGSPNAKT